MNRLQGGKPTTLEDLPPELLDLITCQLPGGAALKLWCTGTSQLQLKLTNGGMTQLDLCEALATNTPPFPSILPLLRRLQHLKVIKSLGTLSNIDYIATELHKLPSTLETLVLVGNGFFSSIWADSPTSLAHEVATMSDPHGFADTIHRETSKVMWNFGAKFPSLKTLGLHDPLVDARFCSNIESLQRLPSSLTCLRLINTTLTGEMVPILPRKLIELKVHSLGDACFQLAQEKWPLELQSLKLVAALQLEPEDAIHVPRSVTRLRNIHLSNLPSASLLDLPVGIRRIPCDVPDISLDLITRLCEPRLQTLVQLEIGRLPSRIAPMRAPFPLTTAIVPILPRSLLTLYWWDSVELQNDEDMRKWPPKLEELKIGGRRTFFMRLDSFDTISLLPASLKVLSLPGFAPNSSHLIQAPSKEQEEAAAELSIDGSFSSRFPRQVHTLSVCLAGYSGRASFSDHLPTNLQRLIIHIRGDGRFRDMLEPLKRSRLYSFTTSSHCMIPLDYLACMPDTLRELSIRGETASHSQLSALLPRQLEILELRLHRAYEGEDFLSQLPRGLRSLSMRDELRSPFCHRLEDLPPNLTSLEFHPGLVLPTALLPTLGSSLPKTLTSLTFRNTIIIEGGDLATLNAMLPHVKIRCVR